MTTQSVASQESVSARLPIAAQTPEQANQRLGIIAALLALYIIWGTTYLGIRIALESYPPYLMMGIRFMMAGSSMFIFLRLRGAPMPTWKEWRAGLIVGVLLLVCGMGSVAMAERSISSGLAAMMVAAAPLWTLIVSLFWKYRPARLEWVGVLIGLGGVALLTLEGNLQANPGAVALMLFASTCWAIGSVWSNHLGMAKGMMGNATEMLCGGVVLVTLGVVMGERISSTPTFSATAALLYLTVLGSLVAMTAYMFLLKNVSHSLATSYAFVNPVIALLLGVVLGGEQITGSALLALPVILCGVAVVAFGRRAARALAEKQ